MRQPACSGLVLSVTIHVAGYVFTSRSGCRPHGADHEADHEEIRTDGPAAGAGLVERRKSATENLIAARAAPRLMAFFPAPVKAQVEGSSISAAPMIPSLCTLAAPITPDATDEVLPAMELLKANVVDCTAYRILALAGEIDASVKDMLLSSVVGLVADDARPLIIDMTVVQFCDPAGLTVAVHAQRHAAACGCVLAFCGLNEHVGKVFRLSGIDQFIVIYPTVTSAALALSGCPPRRSERGLAPIRQLCRGS